jgi:hypothetical protein
MKRAMITGLLGLQAAARLSKFLMELSRPVNIKQTSRHDAVMEAWTLLTSGGNKNKGWAPKEPVRLCTAWGSSPQGLA